MFDTIIFVDKPYAARAFAPFLAQRYSRERSLLVCLGLAGPLQFRYPRGLAYAEYPCVSEPHYDFVEAPYLQARSLADYESWARQGWTRESGEVPAPLSAADVPSAIRAAGHFAYCADPGPSSAHGCLRLLEFLGVADVQHRTDAYILSDLTSKTLSRVFGAGSTPESQLHLAQLAEQASVKRYFEWNWNHNALVVLRSALCAAGLPTDAVISKYEMQLLYFLKGNPVPKDSPAWTEGQILRAMSKWTGSGKYNARLSLGSAASRSAIIENLLDKNFVGKRPNGESAATLFVTARGESFLSLLHPDCEDPDLPARIDQWMDAGFNASRPAIDRYIKTYFGKQKRFFAKSRVA